MKEKDEDDQVRDGLEAPRKLAPRPNSVEALTRSRGEVRRTPWNGVYRAGVED